MVGALTRPGAGLYAGGRWHPPMPTSKRNCDMKLSFPSVDFILKVVLTLIIVGVVVNAVPQLSFVKQYLP